MSEPRSSRTVALALLVTVLISMACGAGLAPRAGARPPTASAPFTIYKAKGLRSPPAVSGHTVVWSDGLFRESRSDVLGYDLATKRQSVIADGPGFQEAPAVSSDWVVWREGPVGSQYAEGSGVSAYDLGTKTSVVVVRLTRTEDLISPPDIEGRTVVWCEDWGEVWRYDLADSAATPSLVCDTAVATSVDRPPAISDGTVVWLAGDTGLGGNGHRNVWGCDVSGGEPFLIREQVYSQVAPVISGDVVVYCRRSQKRYCLFGYDLSTKREFLLYRPKFGLPAQPRISGDIVVWDQVDGEYGDRKIYGYDLSQKAKFPICTIAGDWSAPDISGNLVVWVRTWQAHRYGIYGVRLTRRP